MSESPELVEKLKAADSDIQEYVSALKAINAKQHRRIFKLEAENESLQNRIAAIKEGNADPELDHVDPQTLINRMIDHLQQSGYEVTKKA